MALPSTILQRGTRAAQPAIADVLIGTVYCVTDESNILEQSDGAAWQDYSPAATVAGVSTRTLQATFDGGGAVLVAGTKAYVLDVPFTGTIVRATIAADVSGSCVVDIWKDSYANYPPTIADTITASAKPTLSSVIKNQDATLTGWTTTVTTGDCLIFNIDSATTVTKVMVVLRVTVTG
jgi:hypothetical protein